MGKVAPRSFLGWVRQYVGDRRRSPRRGPRFAVRVPAAVTLLEAKGELGLGAFNGRSVAGETRDLGSSGLTLRVAHVRVGGQYLTDADHHLGVRLELPAGEVSMLTRVVRFEQPTGAGGESGYLLGLQLLKIREEDLAMYTSFLRTLAPLERRRGEGERGRQDVLRLAVPGGEVPGREDVLTPEEIVRAFERFVGRSGSGEKS